MFYTVLIVIAQPSVFYGNLTIDASLYLLLGRS